MKHQLYGLIFVLFFSLSSTAQSLKQWNYADFEKYIASSDSNLVINFWATFCAPCVKEIPYFQEIVRKYNNKKIKLILASFDFENDVPEKILAFAKKYKFTAEIIWIKEEDPGNFCTKVDMSWTGAIPATWFIANKGKYKKFVDTALSPESFEKEILLLLDNSK